MKTTGATLLALAAAVVLALAACGGGDSSGDGSASSADPMISTKTVDGVGPVLVDGDGMALYAADQEADGKVLCTDSCTGIWKPLTVGGGTPTAGGALAGKLGVALRPDGGRQVTFAGRLLYRFAQDDAGTVTGNGAADSFDGRSFTWHVATPSGISTSEANSSPSSDDGGGGYGY